MKKVLIGIAIALGLLILGLINWTYSIEAEASSTDTSYYQYRSIHSRDGIGKFYLGREIAQVMGHQEMLWLERPSRVLTEQPSKVITALNFQPSDIVADIGAGTGYFSFRIAPLVSQGTVVAVDIQPEMLDVLNFLKTENQVANVETVLGSIDNPNLPSNTIDVALMVDAYHEFEYPREMMEAVVKSLKVGGRVILVEYRRENPLIPIKALHKMSVRQVKKEMASVGLTWQETQEILPQQHLMIFKKPKDENKTIGVS